MDPNEIKHLLIDVKRDPNRVQSADLKYPVILLSSKGEIKSILDGQHRFKAIKLLIGDETFTADVYVQIDVLEFNDDNDHEYQIVYMYFYVYLHIL
jgi:hypothetical protein